MIQKPYLTYRTESEIHPIEGALPVKKLISTNAPIYGRMNGKQVEILIGRLRYAKQITMSKTVPVWICNYTTDELEALEVEKQSLFQLLSWHSVLELIWETHEINRHRVGAASRGRYAILDEGWGVIDTAKQFHTNLNNMKAWLVIAKAFMEVEPKLRNCTGWSIARKVVQRSKATGISISSLMDKYNEYSKVEKERKVLRNEAIGVFDPRGTK